MIFKKKPKLLIQDHIEDIRNNIDEFCNKHTLKYSRHPHPMFDNLVLFKYGRCFELTPLQEECRGMVLDIQNNEVVSYPFKKFYNLHESKADDIDWDSAIFEEKLDGSLVTLWNYNRFWNYSTSGTIDINSAYYTQDASFGGLLRKALWELKVDSTWKSDFLNDNYCYMFELQTPENKIVVNHDSYKLQLIGVRDMRTHKEIDINHDQFKNFPIPKTKQYYLNQENMINFVNSRKAVNNEGIVIRDKDFNRVKIKSEEYVQIHRFKGNGIKNVRNCVEIIQNNNYDDIQPYLNSLERKLLEKTYEAYKTYIDDANFIWNNNLDGKSNKEIGLFLKDNYSYFKSIIFQCFVGKTNIDEWFQKVNVKNISEVLEKYYMNEGNDA